MVEQFIEEESKSKYHQDPYQLSNRVTGYVLTGGANEEFKGRDTSDSFASTNNGDEEYDSYDGEAVQIGKVDLVKFLEN